MTHSAGLLAQPTSRPRAWRYGPQSDTPATGAMLVAYGRTQASGSPTKSSNPSPNTPAPSRVQKIQRHRIQSNGSCVSSARQPQPRDGRGPRTHAFHRPRVWWTSRAAPEDDGRAARCCVPGPRPAGRRGSRGSELVDSPVRRQAGGLGRRTRRRRAPAVRRLARPATVPCRSTPALAARPGRPLARHRLGRQMEDRLCAHRSATGSMPANHTI